MRQKAARGKLGVEKLRVLLLAIDPGFSVRQPSGDPVPVESASPYQRCLFHLLRNFALADSGLRRLVRVRGLSFLSPPPARARLSRYCSGMSTLPETEWHYQVARRAAAWRPAVLGLSAYLWSVRDLLIVAQYVRQISPGTKIILGGPEAYGEENALALLSAHPELDFVAFGEGELTFRDLLRALCRGGGGLAEVPFLAYRRGAQPRLSRSRELVRELDEIPSPVLSQSGRELSEHGLAVLSTSRGCPVGCSFCVYSVGLATAGRRIRTNSLERVLSELEHLRRHGVRHVFIPDSNFAANPAVAVPVLKYFLETRRDSFLYFEQKLELVPDTVLGLMRKLQQQGRLKFDAGIQTVTPKALEKASRIQSLDVFLRKMRELDLLRVPDWSVCVDLMIGLPGDTYAGFLKSLDFVHNELFGKVCRPASYYVASLAVLKGTEYHRRAAELGLHFEPVPPYTVMRTPTMSFEEMGLARAVVEALEVLTPAVRFLRLRGVDLPGLFSRCFAGKRFASAAGRERYDRPAILFRACAAFRRYLSGVKMEADLKLFALELLDYCYLSHASLRMGPQGRRLRLPSLCRVPGARSGGVARWPERFWTAYHFKFRYGAQLFQTSGDTLCRPLAKPGYMLLGPGHLGLLTERAYRFLLRESCRCGGGSLKSAMRRSGLYAGCGGKELAAEHGMILRAVFAAEEGGSVCTEDGADAKP